MWGMDKPISMSVKDYLIRIMAVKTMTSERVIEAIVNHQFQSANEAMSQHNSVEISGFGKFFFNTKKAEKKMASMLKNKTLFEGFLANPELSEQKRKSIENVLSNTNKAIEALKPKLNSDEPIPDLRGVEEQVDSPSGYEG